MHQAIKSVRYTDLQNSATHLKELLDKTLIFDRVVAVEHKSELKTRNGSSFYHHFGQKPMSSLIS